MGDESTPHTTGRPTPLPAPGCASIIQIYGGALGRRYLLTEEVTIGRDQSNQVVVDLASVSRQHARLTQRQGVWNVDDLGSTNGTYVNGREVRTETPLANGDLLKLGSVVFKFVEGGNIEALYHEEIYRLTILDGLTGVHNKRYFTGFMEREIARSSRHGRPLSLVMLDIDHFKRINDTHGHPAGDHVLQELARLVADVMRRDELVARYGGEEFAFVLPESDGAEAVRFAERIRRLIEDAIFEFDGEELRTTVSLGVAVMRLDYGTEELIKAADEQLLRAKQAGRNRVCFHD